MTIKPITMLPWEIRSIQREIASGMGKTQTRRILDPQPYEFLCPSDGHRMWNASGSVGGRICYNDRALLDLHRAPKPGDLLWVREPWQALCEYHNTPPRHIPVGSDILYLADRSEHEYWPTKKRQGRHMCRWMSRITLRVIEVRVERVQDIMHMDPIYEGVEQLSRPNWHYDRRWRDYSGAASYLLDHRLSFATLWDSLNGPNAWARNDWVSAMSYQPIAANVDQIKADIHVAQGRRTPPMARSSMAATLTRPIQ